MSGALIEGNFITSYRANDADATHRDMIQSGTLNTEQPSTDIIIRANILHSGSGPWTQSIFMGNEEVDRGHAGAEMYFRNILIEDNVIFNAQANGIRIAASNGLVIRNNTLLHNTASGGEDGRPPKIIVDPAARDVSILDNISQWVSDPAHSSWKVAGNFQAQLTDPLSSDYYGALFVAAETPNAPLEALQALPGGTIEKLGVGAVMTRFNSTPDSLTALATHTAKLGAHTFDASLSAAPSGLLKDKAAYHWDFGDGKSASGRVVTHDYATPGSYEVMLSVSAGGATDGFRFTTLDRDPALLSLRFSASGPDDISSYDADFQLKGAAVPQTNGSFMLTDDNFLKVDRDDTSQLHALNDFTIDFDLQRASATKDAGRIMGIKQSWIVKMEDDGQVVFEITTNAGKTYSLQSTARVTDTKWHEIKIEYSNTNDIARITIDGEASGSTAIDGPTPAYQSYGLVVGWPWGAGFNGQIGDIDIFAGTDETTVSAGSKPPETGGSPVLPPANIDADLADTIAMIENEAYADLAEALSMTFIGTKTDGDGNNIVLAGGEGRRPVAKADGGNNVLIGAQEDSWLVDGAGGKPHVRRRG